MIGEDEIVPAPKEWLDISAFQLEHGPKLSNAAR